MSEAILEYISEINPDALKVDDFDDCIIGIVERFGMEPLILYDKQKMVDKLANQYLNDSMKENDGLWASEALQMAEEYFDYNIIGAWMGRGTPCFATLNKNLD